MAFGWRHVNFYLKSGTVYTNQSTLLHEFYEKVIQSRPLPDEFQETLVPLLKQLRQNRAIVQRADLGAQGYERQSVAKIARNQVSDFKDLNRWYRLSQWLQPDQVLELGTSLGISSLALSLGHQPARVITVEGDSALAHKAGEIHQEMGASQIEIIRQSFDSYLNQSSVWTDIDLAFIDGNHTYTATRTYFMKLLPLMSKAGVLVIHDVLWSSGMYRAWNEIRHHDNVRASLQYEDVGFLFLDDAYRQPIHADWVRWGLKPWTKFLVW